MMLMAFPGLTRSQVNRYEYWFNRQFEAKVIGNIADEEQLSLALSLSAEHLPDGLNSFSVRFRDSEKLWSPALTRFFIKYPTNAGNGNADRFISALQYRFNEGDFVGEDVDQEQNFSFEKIISAANLPNGLNNFSVRFLDDKGLWSPLHSRFFIKLPVENMEGSSRKIAEYEYRLNQGEMIKQSVTAAADISIDETLNAAKLPDGLNSFSIRFKDNSGLWSPFITRFFIKMPIMQVEGEGNELRAYQIWFNEDFEEMQSVSVESGREFHLAENIPAAKLPEGLNKVSIRFRDGNGLWSPVLSRFFVKNAILPMQEENLMASYEYWLEDSKGNIFDRTGREGVSFVYPETPVNPLFLDLDMDLKMIPAGNYRLMFRFRDTYGNLSSILASDMTKTPLPFSLFDASESNFCGSGMVTFSNLSVDADNWLWDFGDGEKSNDFEPQHSFEQPGSYNVSLTASASDGGIEHTSTQIINVYAKYEFTEEHQICAGEVFAWQGNEYSSQGIYNVAYSTANNCDSIFILDLKVIASPDVSVRIEDVTLFAVAADAAYEWINCSDGSIISGETGSSFTPQMSGKYALQVTQNGCTAISDCHEILFSGVYEPYLFSAVKIYPNPTRDRINIVFDEMQQQFSLGLFSQNGQRLMMKENLYGTHHSLSLQNLQPGLYFLQISYGDSFRVIKVIKE
jgi:hypothetical protein